MNSFKASTFFMFIQTAEWKTLPLLYVPYLVYKAQHIYDSWREMGPKNSKYNRTKSGWFNSVCFPDCVELKATSCLKNLEGPVSHWRQFVTTFVSRHDKTLH